MRQNLSLIRKISAIRVLNLPAVVPDTNQLFPDLFETFDHLVMDRVGIAATLFELFASALYRKALVFHQFDDTGDVFDILAGKKPVPFFTLCRPQLLEFLFPKAECAGIEPEHIRYFTDGIVK